MVCLILGVFALSHSQMCMISVMPMCVCVCVCVVCVIPRSLCGLYISKMCVWSLSF